MFKKLMIVVMISGSALAYDSNYDERCSGLLAIAIDAKATPMQDLTFAEFAECSDTLLELSQPLCYSLMGAFTGLEDYSCTLPTYINGRG